MLYFSGADGHEEGSSDGHQLPQTADEAVGGHCEGRQVVAVLEGRRRSDADGNDENKERRRGRRQPAGADAVIQNGSDSCTG